MNAILVSVDYSDLLAITLPWNHHHFERVMVVTTPEDQDTIDVCRKFPFTVDLCLTRSFYANGATFNKWAALEEGLDALGREGWLCVMDADVLWPYTLPPLDLPIGRLCSPLRRMLPLSAPPKLFPHMEYPNGDFRGMEVQLPFPPERAWRHYRHHANIHEWAGYTQIFHASDPVLGPAPWHQVNWKHAGGADSFFQAKWSPHNKVRPPWEVLHLGEAGQNWMGRVTPFLGGNDHLRRVSGVI